MSALGLLCAKTDIAQRNFAPAGRFKNKANVGAHRTRCDIAFAETTGRCAASAMAVPRPLAKQP